MPPTLTPKHTFLSRGKRLSQMGDKMLNFPADDLAVLFTPHFWPSVTLYTVALFTWLVHSGCKGMVAGLEGRNSVLSYQLQSQESPSQCLLELPWRMGAQWGTDPTLDCSQGQKRFGSLQNILDCPKPPATFPRSHLALSSPIRTFRSQNESAPNNC